MVVHSEGALVIGTICLGHEHDTIQGVNGKMGECEVKERREEVRDERALDKRKREREGRERRE